MLKNITRTTVTESMVAEYHGLLHSNILSSIYANAAVNCKQKLMKI